MEDNREEEVAHEVDRTFRVKPGEKILIVIEDSPEEDDDEDDDDEEVDEAEIAEEDDDDDDDEEFLDTNVASEISDEVLAAEIERRKQANPSSDR